MATRISTLTLPELYSQVQQVGKVTPSVFARISMLEVFDKPNPQYCSLICGIDADCKSPGNADISSAVTDEGGIAIVNFADSPFYKDVKASAKILDALMRETCPGIPYRVINAIRCAQKPFSKKKYSITKAKACGNFLKAEIDAMKPRLVIALSTDAVKALGVKKVSQKSHLSKWVYPFANDVPLLITLHPLVTTMIRQNASGAYWGNDFYYIIRQDLTKAAALWRGEIGEQRPAEVIEELKASGRLVVTRTLQDVKGAMEFLNNLPENCIISWDTETTGLDPWAPDARFLTHQFGYRSPDGSSYAITVPLWHRDNTYYDANLAWPYVQSVLENSKLNKVGHNGKFDLKYTRVTTGVQVASYLYDTMYVEHSLCSGIQGSGTYTLKKAVWDVIPEMCLGGYDDLLSFDLLPEEEEEDSLENEPAP